MTPGPDVAAGAGSVAVGDRADEYPPTFGTFIKLCRATWATTARVATGLPGDITHPQFTVLEALARFGPMFQRDIARHILRSSASVNVVVEGLEKRGMVERIRSVEDRRFVRVGLTGEGSAFVERALPVYMQRVREEFAVLTVEEQQELGRLCRKLGLQQIEESEA